MGFRLNVTGQNEENYIHPLTRLIFDDKTRVKVQTVIDMYNRIHSSHYTFNKFQADLRDNTFTIHDIDSKKGRDTKAFIEWCAQPADLVYKEDCFDQIDGKYHKAGEEVRASISNYQYVTNAYTVYTFASDVR